MIGILPAPPTCMYYTFIIIIIGVDDGCCSTIKMALLTSPTVSPIVDSDSFSSFAPTEDVGTNTPKAPPPAARTVAPNGNGEDSGPPKATAVEPDKPKRGRGRPRKKQDTPPKPAKDPNAPKRGRGRPRKNPEATNNKPIPNPDKTKPADGKDAKKPVGRPRKAPPVVDVSTSDTEDPSFDPGEEEAIEMPAAIKKKRGRPKKVTMADTTTTNKVAKETTDNQNESPPPKRKRGRPPKKTTTNNQDDDSEQPPAKQAKLETKVNQAEPTKRPRGRPRKKDKIETLIPESEPATVESTDPTPEFHLVSFEDSSSDGEVGENIASLVSRNGVLQDKDQQQDEDQQNTVEQQDKGGESSDSSYNTPEP